MFCTGRVDFLWYSFGFYGYDYLGNKINEASFNDFFYKTSGNENGLSMLWRHLSLSINHSIFKINSRRDVIFRLGLRIERNDANTKVLKDPYSLYEISTAKEYYQQIGQQLPSNIDPDAAVLF